MNDLLAYFDIHSTYDFLWVTIGIVAQLMFSARFIIQWLTSEREGRSVIPVAFWWFSLAGAVLLLAYGFHRREPVIILGQSTGFVIYLRNIWLIQRERRNRAHAA